MSAVRTRFAPSPTGYLHIGGARTALYNWLYARRTGGAFILRVEDTDKERSTDENTRAILEGMKWLGLDWDEGPILQSSRTELYREHVEKLLAEGKAYRCYCTKEELDAKRAEAQKEKRPYRYDRTCRYPARAGVSGPRTGPFVVRIAFAEEGETVLKDVVKGVVVQQNKELSDEVILRADGSPLYNFCVVVDDADMRISHVLRGDDHLNNTFKQIQMYQALGFELPLFGHMPLIHGPDGKKLSKRNSVVAVDAYRDMGYLPEAMVNFLVRIGWSHGDEEIFTIDRLKEIFDLEGIGKSAGIYDLKKLENLNLHWIKEKPLDDVIEALIPFLEKKGWKAPERPVLEAMIASTRERSRTLVEMADQLGFYFSDEFEYDPKAAAKHLQGKRELLDGLDTTLRELPSFDNPGVESALKVFAESKGLKMGAVAQPLRVALTGSTVSPPITDVVTLLGKVRVAQRIERARSRA